jgi:hypothetical protein
MEREDIFRLREIQEEINDLCDEALSLLPDFMKQTASSYWVSHIKGALDSSQVLGGSMVDFEKQICRLEEELEEDIPDYSKMKKGGKK